MTDDEKKLNELRAASNKALEELRFMREEYKATPTHVHIDSYLDNYILTTAAVEAHLRKMGRTL